MTKGENESSLDLELGILEQPPITPPEHRMIRRIGRGGSGEVWLAQNSAGTYRAIKIVHLRDASSQSAASGEFGGVVKFEPVSRQHDGLVHILQVGGSEEKGYFYYVMELADDVISGQKILTETYVPRTLALDIRRGGRLPIGECIRLGAAMASALGFLHRHNLTHRDLKPSNIIFVNGFPKLADAGLVSAITGTRGHAGTEGFLAPEGSGSAEADIYALGKVLYEMSTGNRAEEYPALPADLGTSRDDIELAQFTHIIMKASRSDPQARYNSTDELMTALLSFQVDQPRPRWSSGAKPLEQAIAVLGGLTGLGVVIYLLSRALRFLFH